MCFLLEVELLDGGAALVVCVGVCAILENSTVCQKSMLSLISVCLGWFLGLL